MARALGRAISAVGWTVVSGLALGVDAAAHRGVCDAGGVGVAVLGSGIDVWYPRSNAALGRELLERGGAVVSEFGPGTVPEGWRFPYRNRIISGLSEAVIVVEAAERSGALITARHALEHGRDVFAVPGDVDRPTSRGANLLIADGAHPVVGVDEVVEWLELVLGPAPFRPRSRVVIAGVAVDGPTSLDDLVDRSPEGTAGVLAEAARLEAEGRVVLEDGWVAPA